MEPLAEFKASPGDSALVAWVISEIMTLWGPGFPSDSDIRESTCNAGDLGLIPGLGISLGEKNSNPLQYSCRKIPWTEEPGGLQSMGS